MAGQASRRFVYLLNVAQRRVQGAVQAEGDGASAARAGLLMAISGDGLPMGTIGRMLDLGTPALSGLIERMVRDGLIERRPDPADGRARIVALTDAGRAARARAIVAARRLNDRLTEDFSENELAIVARWLDAVRDRFPKEGTA